ncbi:predicted protein [Botrytis cinerea T4]|uniref:Uncharacterized protein n=1 Tax=Botryotinia fuckeliana (strain T4) TaxID=999810 RepID=G2Y4V2_BOTF4|nr:predicted protein [Botrytis cinerea T4]
MMIPDIFPKLATAYWIFRKVKGKHDLGTEGRERGYCTGVDDEACVRKVNAMRSSLIRRATVEPKLVNDKTQLPFAQ